MDDLPRLQRRADPLEPVLRRYLLTGDERAMEEVVRETRSRLLAAARRIGQPQDAEDAVQGAYLSLVRHRGAELGAPVLPWLLTAAVRIAYRRKALLTREDRLAEILAKEPPSPGGPLADAVSAEEAARIREDLGRLPGRYRDPLVLHYFQGLSTAETALLLGTTDATVRTRLHRARALLRARWLPRLLLGLVSIPWVLADLGKSSSSGAAFAGVVMNTSGVIGVAVVAVAAGAFLGAKLLASKEPPPDLDAVKREATQPLAAELEKVRAETREVRAAVETERRRGAEAAKENADLRAALEEAKMQAAEAAAAAAKPAPAAVASAPMPSAKAEGVRFSFGEYDAALKEVDWVSVGKNLGAMPPLLKRLVESMQKGEQLPAEEIGRIQQHNGPLVTTALKLRDKLPGSGINGMFTHPAFMTNAIAASLDAAGLPLTEAQAKSLEAVGKEFVAGDAQRLQGYDDRTFALQKVYEEGLLKDRFFDAAFALMTTEQRDALSPAATRGVLSLDLFSSGLMWTQMVQPVTFKDRETLIAQREQGIARNLGVPEGKKAELHALVLEWAAALPREVIEESPATIFGVQPILKVSTVEECARVQIALLQKCAASGWGDDVAAKARQAGAVPVPILQKGE